MSLIAVLRKSGETIASYDVPNHSNNLPSLVESMNIMQSEVNQTLTTLLDDVNDDELDSGDDLEDDSDDDDENAAVNGTKRKGPGPPVNKKIKTS